MSNRKPALVGPKPVWAYAYEIIPAQPEERLLAIKALLDTEGTTARDRARTWEGRFVAEKQVTHILVVSDTPHQDLESNLRLEAALRELETQFSVSAPMPVDESDTVDPVSEATSRPAPERPGAGS